jgi:thiol-disulfide isomerase/thioredoxin
MTVTACTFLVDGRECGKRAVVQTSLDVASSQSWCQACVGQTCSVADSTNIAFCQEHATDPCANFIRYVCDTDQFSQDKPSASSSKDNTPDEITEKIDSHANVFVKFYKPWCIYCKIMASEYDRVETVLNNQGVSNAHVMSVDINEHNEFGQKYQITSVPTLKMFFGEGQTKEYEGKRTAESMAKFIMETTNQGSAFFQASTMPYTASDEDFEQIIGNATTDVLVAFSAPSWCGWCRKLTPEFNKACKNLKGSGVKVIYVDYDRSPSAVRKYKVGGVPDIKLFPANGPVVDYAGDNTGAEIEKWVLKKTGRGSFSQDSLTFMDNDSIGEFNKKYAGKLGGVQENTKDGLFGGNWFTQTITNDNNKETSHHHRRRRHHKRRSSARRHHGWFE